MDIGWAVETVKTRKIRRAGWNAKGMWLCYVQSTPDVELSEGSTYQRAGLTEVTIDAHIDMFTAKGTMQPGWAASQADLLATDWELAD